MRNWMKQLNRVIVLALMLVCLFGCLSLEASAYSTIVMSGSRYEWYGMKLWDWTENKYVTDVWVNDGGTYYFISSSNADQALTGWHEIQKHNTTTYYLHHFAHNGAMQTGWIDLNGEYHYLDGNGYAYYGGVKEIGGKRYYFYGKDKKGLQFYGGWKDGYYFRNAVQSGGYALTGTQSIGGKYYYFDSNGIQKTNGWYDGRYYQSGTHAAASALVNTNTPDGYYVGGDGKKFTGWNGSTYYNAGLKYTGYATQNSTKYYVVNGVKANGTYTASDGTFLFKDGLKYTGWSGSTYYSNGKILTGWQNIDGATYYLNNSGTRVTGIQTNIGGEIYKFGTDGKQYTAGGWQDGYYFNKGSQTAGKAIRNNWTPDDTYVGNDGKVYTGYATQNSTKYYVVNGKKATGTYTASDGTFYFKGGLKYTGWEGDYYYSNGVKQTNTWVDNNTWVDANGKRVANQWVDNNTYWVDANSKKVTSSWVDNNTIYVGSDGRRYTGWVSNTYYTVNGAKLTGWQQIDGSWYYLNPSDGARYHSGWKQVGDNWYYFGTDGKLVTKQGSETNGWLQVGDNWYYVSTDEDTPAEGYGARQYGWQKIGDYWYYFNSEGIMCANNWYEINGLYYYFNSDGVLLQGDENGWLKIGDDWFMLKTSGEVPADGRYSRMTGWVTVGEDEYYMDPETGIMKEESWVPSENGADNLASYVDADGKRVYGDWVDNYNYYIADRDEENAGLYITGWFKDEGNTDKWYFFGADGGLKQQGWLNLGTNEDPIWYYLDPTSEPITGAMAVGLKEINGNKYYFFDKDERDGYNEGQMAANTYVLDQTYYATGQGILIEPKDFHYMLNPYFDYVPGGLYGTGPEEESHTKVVDSTSDNVHINVDVDSSYNQISIGALPASHVDVHLPGESISKEESGWTDPKDAWVWNWSYDNLTQTSYVADASIENRESIKAGNLYAVYHDVATLRDKNGSIRSVDLKVTVVDYSVVCGNGETPVIAFNNLNNLPGEHGMPGVMGLNLSWIQLRYELYFADEENPLSERVPDDTRGNTTYYDVDSYQSVCINDDTNRGIYARGCACGNETANCTCTDICALNIGEVTGHGILNGTCVYLSNNTEYNESEHKYQAGFTEAFEGNAFTRTFSFKNGTLCPDYREYTFNSGYYIGTANGIILNNGMPVSNGSLTVSKQAIPATDETFTFEITLTNAEQLDAVYSGYTFVNGKTTITLKHDEEITIRGIPSGITYKVNEVLEDEESCYIIQEIGTSGTIATDAESSAHFNNWETRTLTVDEIFNASDDLKKSQEFTFKLNAWYDDGNETPFLINEIFTLTDGKNPETFILPVNAGYTIEQTGDAQYPLVDMESTINGQMTEDKDEVFTNTQMLNLTVKKVVDGVTGEKNRDFSFAVSYTKPDGTTGSNEFTLKDGQTSDKITLPYGTTYSVTETRVEGYDTTYSITETDVEGNETMDAVTNVTLKRDTNVIVTNSAIEHKLKVKKSVIGNAEGVNFSFTLTWNRSGSDEKIVEEFTLLAGADKEIILPTGCSYEIKEKAADGYVLTKTEGDTSVSGMDGDKNVVFENTQLVPLTLTKIVSGNMGEKDREFEFTVTVNGVSETVKLKHKDSETIMAPYGATYTITETDYSEEGYNTTISVTGKEKRGALSESGTITGETSVIFENSKGFSIPTGLTVAVLPFLGMVLFGGGIGITQLLGGRKSRRGRYLDR